MQQENIRIIKKYQNRRLYDTELSSYITLNELKQYVIEHIPFKVIDAKTEEDVTRSSLIQIILELEGGRGAAFFSQEILENMLRFYGHPMQTMFQEYLKQMFDVFFINNQHLNDSSKLLKGQEFLNSLNALSKQNMDYWTKWWSDRQK